MKELFSQINLANKHTIKNRIAMAPMTTYSSNDDLTISDQEIEYYKHRNNQVGLLITGCTFVSENGIGFTNQFAGYDDKFIPSLSQLAQVTKAGGAKAILQIFHAGNKAPSKLVQDIVSASNVAPANSNLKVRELSEQEIQQIIQDFGHTTRRAIQAGFDGIEIHGAHGFLIQNFLSPYFNKRNDQWGGSIQNRMRFALEIVKQVKQVVEQENKKDFIIGYRISPDEPIENGLKVIDTLQLTEKLVNLGVDYIHTSLFQAYQSKPQGYEKTYVELFAQQINQRATLISAGQIQTPDQAKQVLNLGADLVALGQVLITDPDWIKKTLSGNEDQIEHALSCKKVKELKLPDLMWEKIQKTPGWFEIKD
ncbi:MULTISPECIES: NADH-dependent flavin oxidoreductase [unclassified Mycoplasma]|uniref:NADH-dependent flavin oxidoreductase n=1 Tax=unclassified Mycoplasma TaxID=2683645 RepID=UPI00211CAF8D|nr:MULTISPECIES: NADH-dependent flavin oxidoreductase [unclassified Mycoplasma]UUM19748.1 NADH-dependent flavin oxidoreductase [Mycoplasma sp. 1578d]UUM24732.1 NADH-dependent flavin oxidoreductase [Mycoplasma sp. 3686d]